MVMGSKGGDELREIEERQRDVEEMWKSMAKWRKIERGVWYNR